MSWRVIGIFNAFKFMPGWFNSKIDALKKQLSYTPFFGVKPFSPNKFGANTLFKVRQVKITRVSKNHKTTILIVATIAIVVVEFDVWHLAKVSGKGIVVNRI